MGINRKVLEKVLKESDTFAIKVIDRQVLKRSVLATIEFEDLNGNIVTSKVDFHVGAGWTYKNGSSFVYLKSFCEYVYKTYKSERSLKIAEIKGLIKQMEEILDNNWFTFDSFLSRKKLVTPVSKKDLHKFVENNHELCEEFLYLLQIFEKQAA